MAPQILGAQPTFVARGRRPVLGRQDVAELSSQKLLTQSVRRLLDNAEGAINDSRRTPKLAVRRCSHDSSLPALQATVDWSYDLLDPSAQTVLRRLGPFVGGFTLEAAEVVCTTVDVNSAVAG